MADTRVAIVPRSILRPAGALVVGMLSVFVLAGAANNPQGNTAVPDFSGPWQHDNKNPPALPRRYQAPAPVR